MEIETILSIGLIGSLVSVLMEYIKEGFDSREKKIVIILLSIVAGTIYWWLSDTQAMSAILGILATSNTVYALLLKKSE